MMMKQGDRAGLKSYALPRSWLYTSRKSQVASIAQLTQSLSSSLELQPADLCTHRGSSVLLLPDTCPWMDDCRTTEFFMNTVFAVLPLYEYLSLTHARLNNVLAGRLCI